MIPRSARSIGSAAVLVPAVLTGYASAADTMLGLSRLTLVERDSLGFDRLTRAATG